MPILGADMQEGTVIAWRKQPGDRIERGEIIAEVETDKANVEIESWMTGVLERVLVEPENTVAVGTPIAIIREDGERAVVVERPAAPSAPAERGRPSVAEAGPTVPARAPEAAPSARRAEGERLRVSPTARKLAAEVGVDLASLKGTGPDGRIMRRDVERAAAAAVAATAAPFAGPPPVEEGRLAAPVDREARMRRAIAAAMERSAREIPQYSLRTSVDLSWAIDWLDARNAQRPYRDRILPVALFIRATALALRETPELNAGWREGAVVTNEGIHVGVAIFLRGGGLIAPAIRDADQKDVDEVMAALTDLTHRARGGSLRSSELTDATITLTSLGEQGVEEVVGLVYPPQAAIVGFGKIVERPWAVKGGVVARPVVTVTLSADHRVTDGRLGSQFLNAIDDLLQRPERL